MPLSRSTSQNFIREVFLTPFHEGRSYLCSVKMGWIRLEIVQKIKKKNIWNTFLHCDNLSISFFLLSWDFHSFDLFDLFLLFRFCGSKCHKYYRYIQSLIPGTCAFVALLILLTMIRTKISTSCGKSTFYINAFFLRGYLI